MLKSHSPREQTCGGQYGLHPWTAGPVSNALPPTKNTLSVPKFSEQRASSHARHPSSVSYFFSFRLLHPSPHGGV